MTERSKIPLGDLLAMPQPPREPPEPGDPYEFVLLLALCFRVDPDKLLAEIEGKGPLAEIARALTRVPKRPREKGGRRANNDRNFSLLRFVDARTREGVGVEDAVIEWLKSNPDESANLAAVNATIRRLNRLRDKYPSELGRLFLYPRA